MICTTLQHKSCAEILDLLDSCQMAEIRIDSCPSLSDEDLDEIFACDIPLVATCRISEIMKQNPALNAERSAHYAELRLKRAMEAGAAYVDLEIEAPKDMAKRIQETAGECGTLLIRSYHDYEGTDSMEALKALVEKCFRNKADIAKIVTTARTASDVGKVLALYGECEEGRLIAHCMGEAGRQSRLESLRLGAPFAYAALAEDDAAAPGQWTAEEMRRTVYGSLPTFNAEITVPSSKSYAQRAILAAALAKGESRLGNYTACRDSESALEVARRLGADVKVENAGDFREIVIRGIDAYEGCLDGKIESLPVGESGLLARLCIPLMAQLSDNVTITGEGTLSGRKLSGASAIMSAVGSSVKSEKQDYLPMTVHGRLGDTQAEISGESGSQLVSGLLMALPFSPKDSTLLVENPKSIPYSFMTVDVLGKFGIKVSNEMSGNKKFLESDGDWSLCSEMVFKMCAGQKYTAADFCIEGDWSSAVPYLCAGAVFGQAYIDGLSTDSLQADLAVMDILMAAGATLTQMDDENGEIYVRQAPLLAFSADLSHCPDLFPVTAVFAAFCQGETRLRGIGRLADKECDRCDAILTMLLQLGVDAYVSEDELIVNGHSLAWRSLNGALLHGGKYSSSHDHRMVMALRFAALGADSPVEIDDSGCVAKSSPDFNEDFRSAVVPAGENGR